MQEHTPTSGKPVVAIVGRPNVGKSTLFNRLIGRRTAIVEDIPGITRDRIEADCTWRGQSFKLVDTGGVTMDSADPMMEQIRIQAQTAMNEASVIVFVTDADEGLTPADEELADALRGAGPPVLLAVNKSDNLSRELNAAEFYSLGWPELFTISSVHGHGVAELLDRIIELLPLDLEWEETPDDQIKLAIVGRPNVGKSSLLNAILGEPRAIVSEIAGTTRDATDTPFTWNDRRLLLIDTAGIRRAGKVQGSVEYYSVLRAHKAMERCQVALVVIDAHAGLSDGDKRVAGQAEEAGCGVVLVINKWDLVDAPDKRRAMREFAAHVRKQCPYLSYAPLAFCSALNSTGIDAVLDTAIEASEAHAFRISTGVLNRLIREAADARPYSRRGKALKIYYATMPSTQPPTVVLFVNDPQLAHFSYLRYLENAIRKQYRLEGTPIRISVRNATPEQRKD